ncbi:MAG: polysaccharide deacetylase family protein [Planctomycetota bacterium]|jgi:peptidoglycan/xylan/chitin deacetylase (PgdA/CDA1 family)
MSVYDKRGSVVRVIYLLVAMLYWPVTKLRRRSTVILCYHGVKAQQRRRFARQMAWIALRGRGRVRVTFDDAFANLLDNALPVMHELGIPATVFAVADNLGSPPTGEIAGDHPDASEVTMTATQIRQVDAEYGVTFGSHGATHRRLTELSANEVYWELTESRTTLEQIVGKPIEDFAPPHGACDQTLIDAAIAAGYRRVFTVGEPQHRDKDRAEGTVIDRMKMSPDVWPIEFSLTAAGAYGWLPAFRRLMRRLRRGPTGPDDRRKRILAVASGGGHWVQLLRLRPAFAGEHVVWVTVNKAYRTDVGTAPFRVVNDATRWNKLNLLMLAARMAWIALRQRPDVVVTTGAAPGYFAVLFGKLLGARTAWIDSMANAEHLSLAGRKIRPWADLWLTQWPKLAKPQGPHYQGAVL